MARPEDLTIVSGGQTGADRAALDFAIRHGLTHGGWCPRGRKAEDGAIDDMYQLDETPTDRYDQRTRWNVRDTDATLLLTVGAALSGGTGLTAEVAQQFGKPWLHIARDSVADVTEAGKLIREFLYEHKVRRLNVAGPRASQEPEVVAFVAATLEAALIGD